ncbi:hypothetical protein STEG23_006826, partial [Scotinomys teguina]
MSVIIIQGTTPLGKTNSPFHREYFRMRGLKPSDKAIGYCQGANIRIIFTVKKKREKVGTRLVEKSQTPKLEQMKSAESENMH